MWGSFTSGLWTGMVGRNYCNCDIRRVSGEMASYIHSKVLGGRAQDFPIVKFGFVGVFESSRGTFEGQFTFR